MRLYSWRLEDWRKDKSSYGEMDYIPGDWKIREGMDPPTGQTEDDSWRLGDWSKVNSLLQVFIRIFLKTLLDF